MSIANQITALNTDKTDIASAITAKGGTLSQNAGFDTFAADIATIPAGASEAATVNRFFAHEITNFPSACFSGLQKLGPYMFYSYRPAEGISVDLSGTTVTTVGVNCFYNAYIKEINLGSVTTIENNAFIYVGKLLSVTIPATVTSIGGNNFQYTSVKTMTFLGTNPPTIAANSLPAATLTDLKIYVPYGLKQTYVGASTLWATYESVIEELPQS